MTDKVVLDKAVEAFKGQPFELIASNLSSEQEAELLKAFGQE
jgi:uncharacterized membrane protein